MVGMERVAVRRAWAEWLAKQKWVPYFVRQVLYKRRFRHWVWRDEYVERVDR